DATDYDSAAAAPPMGAGPRGEAPRADASGTIASGAGGRYPRLLWGRTVLYRTRHRSISTFASSRVSKISPSSNSSRSLPLKLTIYPFSHGLPGSMYNVPTPTRPSQLRTALAVNSGPLSLRI